MIHSPYQLLKMQALTFPNSNAVAFSNNKFTYCEFLVLTRKIAKKLSEVGIKAGDIVLLDLSNPLLSWAISVALSQIGSVSCDVTSNPEVSNSVKFHFKIQDDSKNQIILTNNKKFLHINSEWISSIENTEEYEKEHYYDEVKSLSRLILSSGSTGSPKIIPLDLSLLMNRAKAFSPFVNKIKSILLLGNSSNSVGLYGCILPLLHGGSITFAAYDEDLLKNLSNKQYDLIIGSPQQLMYLIGMVNNHTDFKGKVIRILSAGDFLSEEIKLSIFQKFGNEIEIYSVYGSTETGPIAKYLFTRNDLNEELGEIFPFVKIKNYTKDEFDNISEYQKLCIQSDLIAQSYYNEDVNLSKNGWFYSNDIGCVTNDGYLKIVGRDNNVVNIGGIKINTLEIDHFLLMQNNILSAFCFKIASQNSNKMIYGLLTTFGYVDIKSLKNETEKKFNNQFDITLKIVDKIPSTSQGKYSLNESRKIFIN